MLHCLKQETALKHLHYLQAMFFIWNEAGNLLSILTCDLSWIMIINYQAIKFYSIKLVFLLSHMGRKNKQFVSRFIVFSFQVL